MGSEIIDPTAGPNPEMMLISLGIGAPDDDCVSHAITLLDQEGEDHGHALAGAARERAGEWEFENILNLKPIVGHVQAGLVGRLTCEGRLKFQNLLMHQNRQLQRVDG